MRVHSTTAATSLALLLCGALASCAPAGPTEQEIDAARLELTKAADALSVSVLRPGAERAFARKGHPVEGALVCSTPSGSPSEETSSAPGPLEGPEATASNEPLTAGDDGAAGGVLEEDDGEGRLRVVCTGRGREGEQLRFEGSLLVTALAERGEGDDSLRGDFLGVVDGEELFTMDCFQCSPEAAGSPEDVPPEGDTPPDKAEGNGG
ncbi:hypothetical protein ACFW4K_03560 [Nocardiopsis alba]|uniref:hypothetical protein n=1 Tax=Nocardiopsis alba TaxID=53437 RepID=UPI003671DF9F